MENDIALIDEVKNRTDDQGHLGRPTSHPIRNAKVKDSQPVGHGSSSGTTLTA
jgi:hypothetical protein